MNKRIALAAAIAALSVGSAQAALTNAGFETGDLTGWTNNAGGNANVVTSHYTTYSPAATYTAAEGNYFLAIASGTANVWQTVTQAVSVGAGETLAGKAAFNWGDYPSYYDGVRVRILDVFGTQIATAFYDDGVGKPSGYNGPWTDWSWTAASAGTYYVEYGSRNTLDGGGPNQTYGYFDAATNVPEPASLAMLGLGLAGLAGLRRKRA